MKLMEFLFMGSMVFMVMLCPCSVRNSLNGLQPEQSRARR